MTVPSYRHTPADFHLTQQGRRQSYNVKDRFHRSWLISTEMTRSGWAPVGAIIPCFDDPLQTPQKYLSIDPRQPYTLRIDFDQWIREQEQALEDWQTRKDEAGRDLYGEKYDPEAPPPKELLRLVGKPPRDPEEIRAARGGDQRWLKGGKPTRQRKPGRPRKATAPDPAPEEG